MSPPLAAAETAVSPGTDAGTRLSAVLPLPNAPKDPYPPGGHGAVAAQRVTGEGPAGDGGDAAEPGHPRPPPERTMRRRTARPGIAGRAGARRRHQPMPPPCSSPEAKRPTPPGCRPVRFRRP